MAIDITIRDNHLHFDGINFFRGNANLVQLGSAGAKKTPSTQTNYLSVEGNIPLKKLKINRVTTIELNGTKVTGADVSATIDVPGVGPLSASAVSSRLKEDTLKLVKIDVLPRDIVEAANESPKVLDALKASGNDGRLAHQVVVILESSTAETLRKGVAFELTTDDGRPILTARAGSKDVATVEINSGATFAYLLLKPKWDANLKKNWNRIESWSDDQWSLY
jgi:hypothetical protein